MDKSIWRQPLDIATGSHPLPETDINPHQCDHTPDYLVHERTVEMPTYHIDVYRCLCCGEEVVEYLPFDEKHVKQR